MMFKIKSFEEKKIKKKYDQAMRELDTFFELGWIENKPKIFLVKDRDTINKLRGTKTPNYLVGWINGNDVFVLDKNNYEKNSCHKYSEKEYFSLIKHELTHVFTQVHSKIFDKSTQPDWLWEGIAIYLSGQNENKKRKNKFKNFLQHYHQNNKNTGVFKESGFAIEFLVKKFGEKKLLKLIKSLKKIDSKEKFAKKFKNIYGFELKYENFQKT